MTGSRRPACGRSFARYWRLLYVAAFLGVISTAQSLADPSPSPQPEPSDTPGISVAGASPVADCPQFFDAVPPATLHRCVVALAAKGWGLSAVADVKLYTYSGAFAPGLPRREPENDYIGLAPEPKHEIGLLPGLDGIVTDVAETGKDNRCGEEVLFAGYLPESDARLALVRRAYVTLVSQEAKSRCVPADHALVYGQEDEGGRDLALFVAGDPKAYGSLLYASPAEFAAFEKRAALRGFQPIIVRSDFELWGRTPTRHRIDRKIPRTPEALLARVRAGFARGETLTSFSTDDQTLSLVWAAPP